MTVSREDGDPIGMASDPQLPQTSPSDCRACTAAGCAERPPAGDREAGEPSLAGMRLCLGAIGLFLAPIILAILGAMILGDRPETELLGAVGGLAVGMGGAAVVARLLHRHRPDRAPES